MAICGLNHRQHTTNITWALFSANGEVTNRNAASDPRVVT